MGLKCHEDVIDALGGVVRGDARVVAVLVGGGWAGASAYERRLRSRAVSVGGGRILMPATPVSETLTIALFADPAGNTIGMLTEKPAPT